MNIKLLQITIENFKGIRRFTADFGGNNAAICAENGAGKTTVYDAFLWTFFGKDSTGRKDFEIRPLDAQNKPLGGLVVKVEIALSIDGRSQTLRKELHEKVVKGELKGYETSCWIDDVPKKVGEYQQAIDAMISEDTCKALTDLAYFNTKLHWTDRRLTLLDLAGAIGTPKGFAKLLSSLNGRSLEEQAKMLTEQKKGYEKEQQGIGPRIDELSRGLPGLIVPDEHAGNRRQKITQAIATLDSERKSLLDAEKTRQARIEAVNKLAVERLHRQSQIRSEMKQTQALLVEKAGLITKVQETQNRAKTYAATITVTRGEIEAHSVDLGSKMTALGTVRSDCRKLENGGDETQAICFNCGQPLPVAMREDVEARTKKLYAEKVHTGNELKRQIDVIQEARRQAQTELQELEHRRDKAMEELEATEHAADARMVEIDKLLANPPEPDYASDEQYRKLSEQIEQAQKEIGEPVAAQMEAIEARREAAEAELNKLNKALAQADRAKQDKARIDELGNRERELAQKIADCDKQLAEIKQYNLEQAKLIETAVNGKFKYVTWKMFDYFLNGDINDKMCEALYQGVPYQDLSTGQHIRVGVDIVNVLSRHYGVSVPMFVDHLESLTLPLEAEAQTIGLRAVEGVKELVVELQENISEIKTSTSKKRKAG